MTNAGRVGRVPLPFGARHWRTPMRITHVVHGRRPVTAELALRLGRYFGQSPRYWLNLQNRYDMDVGERVFADRVVREVRPSKALA